MNIHLHIERIILDGVNIPHGHHHLLQTSVEAELVRLFTNGGLSPTLGEGIALPHVSANGIQLASGNDPAHVGSQIAQSIYRGIGRE